MEKPNRVRQWYGYIVCLIAVIVGLICTVGVLNNAFDLANPVAASARFDESLTSFEAYKASRGQRTGPADEHPVADTASDAALRIRYEALRADRVSRQTFQATKGLVTDLILLLIAIGLFIAHWRWLRRLPSTDDPGGAA